MTTGNSSQRDCDALEIGQVVGVHGVAGGVRVRLHDAESQALVSGQPLLLQRGEQRWSATVVRVAKTPGDALAKVWFSELGSRDQAEAWKGATLAVDRRYLPPLDEGEFFLADAIGKAVKIHDRPTWLGNVAGVTSNGAQDLLIVHWTSPAGQSYEWLMPAMRPFVVALTADEVVVDVPEGFLPDELEAHLGREGALIATAIADERADEAATD